MRFVDGAAQEGLPVGLGPPAEQALGLSIVERRKVPARFPVGKRGTHGILAPQPISLEQVLAAIRQPEGGEAGSPDVQLGTRPAMETPVPSPTPALKARTPDWPASRRCQASSTLHPRGETKPKPVMTTRRPMLHLPLLDPGAEPNFIDDDRNHK